MPPKPDPRQDQALHEALRIAILAGRVELATDGLHLHKPTSPVYVAWDHLGPLLALMLFSLLVLLFQGLGWGIAAMTVAILVYIFGMRWWVGQQVHRRTLDAMLRNAYNWTLVWEFGGVALIRRGDAVPCVAPKGDWRAFARRLTDLSFPMPDDEDEAAPAAKEPPSP